MFVTRNSNDQVCANGNWYDLQELVNAAYNRAKKAGSKNPAFDIPSWFYTGSPYANEIVALGCTTIEP